MAIMDINDPVPAAQPVADVTVMPTDDNHPPNSYAVTLEVLKAGL